MSQSIPQFNNPFAYSEITPIMLIFLLGYTQVPKA